MSSPERVKYIEDTIAARATAQGKGGVAIVRVSGPDALTIAKEVTGLSPQPRFATFTKFVHADGSQLDEGLLLCFKGPESFTGEDVAEFHGHGGPVVVDMLLNRVVSLGARIAQPGEFSQRAFLNDKLDLVQAEAIADLIESGTEAAAKAAMNSLQGEFSRAVNEIQAGLIELRIYVEAAIDFPEEEVDFLSDDKLKGQLVSLIESIVTLISKAKEGAMLNDGVSVALIGKPNAGKSSVMNRLTGQETSIVTNIPGTTRDVVRETLQMDGLPIRLVDTAGLRDSQDEVEAEGVRRALAAGESADLVIEVVDLTDPKPESRPGNHWLTVFNKCDLVEASAGIAVSAKTGVGFDELKRAMRERLGIGEVEASGFTARRRHLEALRLALQAMQAGEAQLSESLAGELLAEELKIAQQHLGEITGEHTADDLLGEIFSSFCIGK